MAKRAKHPNKEIESALRYAENKGWKVEKASGHAWGTMKCPTNSAECWNGMYCHQSVWGTPKNPEIHARLIRKIVDKCIYSDMDKE